MLNLLDYPLALQLLMQTDGTVTELIQLLAKEKMLVVKLSEKISPTGKLHRHIYLQGQRSQTHWLFAKSVIYLQNLSADFVSDLMEKSIPIGSLWAKYRVETYKQQTDSYQQEALEGDDSGFSTGTRLLCREYEVYSKKTIIMKITEKFPIEIYKNLA